MQTECLGIVCNCNDLFDTFSPFAKIREHIPYRIVKTNVISYHTARSLARYHPNSHNRTELLYAHQIRNVHCSCIGVYIRCILSRFEIVEHVHFSVTGKNFALQNLHIAEVTDLHISFTHLAETCATFVFSSLYEEAVAGPAVSFALTDEHLV
jgi:hypothetical protein